MFYETRIHTKTCIYLTCNVDLNSTRENRFLLQIARLSLGGLTNFVKRSRKNSCISEGSIKILSCMVKSKKMQGNKREFRKLVPRLSTYLSRTLLYATIICRHMMRLLFPILPLRFAPVGCQSSLQPCESRMLKGKKQANSRIFHRVP